MTINNLSIFRNLEKKNYHKKWEHFQHSIWDLLVAYVSFNHFVGLKNFFVLQFRQKKEENLCEFVTLESRFLNFKNVKSDELLKNKKYDKSPFGPISRLINLVIRGRGGTSEAYYQISPQQFKKFCI